MRSLRVYEWIGIVLILTIGIIHMYTSPDEFDDAPYLGIMFIGAFLCSIISAVGIYLNKPLWGWGTGLLVALGSIVGYILSRTVGLPISGVEPWGPAIGYLSLVLEFLFVAAFTRMAGFKQLVAKLTQTKSV